ncbi:polysaccharide biosynthesis/export family protein [Qipengyuania sp. DSG2-2]|uniref:polysaccharide biosynthesis/export family protein n=1 Tax=Qipengyuania sp. DGS2-2 TaxID=3349631 RepID=UPI0036D2AD9D
MKNSPLFLAAMGLMLAMVSACTSTIEQASPPIAQVAEQFEMPLNEVDPATYRLGPQDQISIRTFREEDLSFDQITVDSTGAIAFPILGRVEASGATVFDLAQRLENGLAQSYLRNPDVTVMLVRSAAQRITVEGAVAQSGVFPIDGDLTLLGAIARARGTTEIASRDDVVIFRTIDNQRMGALFDLTAIERGYADDPTMVAGDVVVVHTDGARRNYLEALRLSPIAASIFRIIPSL